jgi:uncharacterized membrane protein YccC
MEAFAAKAKEPFKTALAIVISYGIALAMDWDNPFWAGFAVLFISLSTAGQSFNKGAMRMFGTLVGIAAALTFIAVFPQERWSFLLVLSVYIGICTYLMNGPKLQYFWNVSGFVCVLLCMSAGPDPVNAFDTAVLRAQETGLGVLVYSLVAILVWPVTSRKDFFEVAGELASGQRQFCQAGLKPGEENDPGQAQALKEQLLQAQTRFQKLLDAAESDTREVSEMRHFWRLYQEQTGKLTPAIASSVQSLAELEAAKTPHLMTNLDAFLVELDNRFAGIGSMLAGQAAEHRPDDIDLAPDTAGLRTLSHFQRAAVVVFHTRLKQLDRQTRALFETTCTIGGFCEPAALPPRTVFPPLQWPDPDRMLAVTRVLLTLWLAYVAWIYVDSIPGGTSIVTMACVFGMIMASMPMVSLRSMFKPLMVSVVFGSLVYMLILPKLSGFLSLGSLLFVTVFSISYLLSDPRQALAKAFSLAMFVSIASINNQQVYSFSVVATNVLMFPVLFMLLAITSYFPVNLRQEKSFLRLLDRYFHSCGELLSGLDRDVQQSGTRLERLHRAFHIREISSIPTKLAGWARFLDTKVLPGTDAKDVQALLPGLQDLAVRIRELDEVRGSLRNQFLIDELGDVGMSWRRKLREAFASLGSAPDTLEPEAYRSRLDGAFQRLETRIRETLNRSTGQQFGREDGEHFYSLLEAYRGVTESLGRYATTAGAIDWAPWHEERF